MAGKPELSVTHQSQTPGVQNVVVYVSNDNIAQAYAVGQQNVAGYTSQDQTSSIQTSQNQNGAVVYANSAHAVTQNSAKTFIHKSQSNGAIAHNEFYVQNGFPQPYHNSVNPNVSVLNNSSFDGVKNVISFSAPNAEVYSEKTDMSGRPDNVTTESGYVVMGAEVQGQSNVMFPRCDSVRSETAESSCSSLSSGDSHTEVVIQAPSGQSGELVMYDNGVSVNVRPAQPLGNLVLTMVPPAPNGQPHQVMGVAAASPQPSTSQHAATNHVNIPFGWKRIVTNGIVIYISPSSTALSSLEQVKEYLMTEGTCKCGLECPLKYELVFNFDSKVTGKPVVMTPEASQDLTKLCNHKRKLLALGPSPGQSRPPPQLQQPQPPPALTLQQVDPNKLRKDGGLKRKKRKVGPYAGVSVSQLLAQREKMAIAQQQQQMPQQQMPQQQQMPYKEQAQSSPQFIQQPQQWPGAMVSGVQQPTRPPPGYPEGMVNPQNPGVPQFIRYPNQPGGPINRVIPGSPSMVGGQMMLQQGNMNQQNPQQIQNPQMMYQMQHSQQINQNQQIIGPNGQVINIHQNPQAHHLPQGHQIINNQMGNQMGVISTNNGNIIIQGQQMPNQMQQHRMPQPHDNRTPNRPPNMHVLSNPQNMQQDFNQRIHHQQQFYNQNIPYQHNIDQNKMMQHQQQQQQAPRSNFISNSPIFTSYRTDPNQIQVQQNQMVMVSTQNQPKPNQWQQNKPGTPVPHIQNPNNQNHPIVSIQNHMSPHVQNQNVYDRVPPLHHHTPPPPVWNEDMNRRKGKLNKVTKKQRPYVNEQQQRFGSSESCPNVDVRQMHGENKLMMQNQYPNTSGPSFMEDPSGYLAQQAALLNSTLSRQTGVNNCSNYMCHSPNMQSPVPQNVPNSQPMSVPIPSNIAPTMKPTQVYNNRINVQSITVLNKNQQNQQNNDNQMNLSSLPDSSAVENANSPYGMPDPKKVGNQNQFGKNQVRVYQQQSSSSQPSTPNPNFEENPVTSSTFSEKYAQSGYLASPDSRPIQGGTVSTSNGSPIDGHSSQSEPSSAPSTPNPLQQRSSDTPMMSMAPSSNSTSICTSTPTSNASVSTPQHQNNQVKLEGYCPPPHAAGSPLGITRMNSVPFSVHSGMITTMASGRTFGSNTITSVLAGRASTSTVSINSPATIPLTSSSPTSFTSQSNALMSTATNPSPTVSKSPLEMVQSVVSSIQLPHSQPSIVSTHLQQISPQQIVKSQGLPPGHILVSSGGQLLMATTGNGQHNIMAPPPPKLVSNTSPMPPLSTSQMITNVTASVTQVIPAVAQQVLGQQTLLVNALPTPFVIQPGVVTVDGMTVGQNMQIPHLVTGNVIQQQIQIDNHDQSNRTQHHSPGFNRQPALLSPESKKKGKKRKMSSSQTVASMLHIASQQNSGMVMQQPHQGFTQQSFQMAHSPQGIQGPMLQALTIVPGKHGVPSQIVMNGQQGGTGTFSTQQIITNSQPAPQINLLQPVNLLNGATGVVQNFPTIQQFIVPNLGGMVMTADGTLIQDQNVGMQLQLQNVNGQNVLTQVQNSNVFAGGQSILAAGPAGMVIRTPNTNQGKIIQQQHSPGAQFLSPNGGQFVMNGAQFSGQLSPLVANVSPTQQVTFSTSPQQVRPNTSLPQEFIQCNQMGQTLMVPCAPQTITVTSASNQQNTTYVQQNTTIVQQQTTMVSNNQIQNFGVNQQNNQDQNFVLNNGQGDKNQVQSLILQRQSPKSIAMMRQSVSTQTAAKQNLPNPSVTAISTTASSPPDTTTHSPLGGRSPTNADTTTHGMGSTDDLSPAPSNNSATGNYTDAITVQGRQNSTMAMVHCVSSSEPDSGEMCGNMSQSEMDWSQNNTISFKPEFDVARNDFEVSGNQSVHISRKSETPTHMAYVESSTVVSGMQLLSESVKNQESIVSSRNYERSMKRKHGDTLVIMETRHMQTALQDDEENSEETAKDPSFTVGDVVWGSAHGSPSWPGKLVRFSEEKSNVLVRWFGRDKTPSMVNVATLQTLTEGLEAHHRARKKCRKSRKLNTQLENAIQEAMVELDRISEKTQPTLKEAEKFDVKKNHTLKSTARPR